MARRKADELEDFSGKDLSADEPVNEGDQKDVEEGSKLLKGILLEWSDTVRERGIEGDEKEMIGTFKGLLDRNKSALDGNVWIREAMLL
jgi:hypothetical protein